MVKKYYLFIFVCWLVILTIVPLAFTANASSTEKKVAFTLRLGQGGFQDSRSLLGVLGGGQIALDFKFCRIPFGLSLSTEYYTNSPDPTHFYEIKDFMVINILYITQLTDIERITVFAGDGFGQITVPKGEEDSEKTRKGSGYNLEAGVNTRVVWKMGVYGVGKYLFSQKIENNMKVIDFSEWIWLLGLTFNFKL